METIFDINIIKSATTLFESLNQGITYSAYYTKNHVRIVLVTTDKREKPEPHDRQKREKTLLKNFYQTFIKIATCGNIEEGVHENQVNITAKCVQSSVVKLFMATYLTRSLRAG